MAMAAVGTGAKLEDSNMANYGSQEHKDARKAAAESEKEFVGAGTKVGLEVWRVENRRTENDTPDFGVKRWPKDQYGEFYRGDSYLVLNTYKVKVDGKVTDKLGWDVHFWLGSESSQDEIGVAAYKAVELDDLLDDGPVQHRETEKNESPLFQSYFPSITYMEGGIASGFRKVTPEEYKPRLFQVRQAAKSVKCTQVDVSTKAMNHGDTFILDAGLKIYVWIGEHSSAFEKSKGGSVAHNMVQGRLGKSKLIPQPDEDFWKILGDEKDILPPQPDKPAKEDGTMDASKCVLFRLSDASGKMTFKKEGEGNITAAMLDSNDVFILDGQTQLFVWVGKGASKAEKSQAMKHAMEYCQDQGRPATLPITRVMEGQVNHEFGALIKW